MCIGSISSLLYYPPTHIPIHITIHHSLCESKHFGIMVVCRVVVCLDTANKRLSGLCILLHLLAEVLDNFKATEEAAKPYSVMS